MKQAIQIINSTQLRQFAPLGKLSDDDAQELLRTSITVHLSPGTPVFNQEANGKQLFYLLEGKIELRGKDTNTIIEAGSKEACKPIGKHLPGQKSATALENSTLVSFDADMLDLFLNWTNPNAYVVNETEAGQDHEWLNRLLKSRGQLRLSEEQIKALLERMSEVHFNKGDVVISQDADDEFFYIIKQGHAVVSRKPTPSAKEIKLAELGEGDTFGEESILMDTPRGATVTMQEPGDLMRLSKKDFSELLAEPLLETVQWQEAQAMVDLGAKFLDIRLEDEFKAFHIPDSINIPLPLLRLKVKQLKQRNKYIVYCDDGSRSAVAAFLLNQNGFDTCILDGGMASALPHLATKEMAHFDTIEETGNPTENPAEATEESSASEQEKDQHQLTERGGQHRSLADYWGATVDTAADESFSDSDVFKQIEKTRLTPVSNKTSAAKSISNKEFVLEELKHTNVNNTISSRPNHQPQTRSHHDSHLTRNLMLTFTAIGIAAVYGMYEYMPDRFVTTSSTPVAEVMNDGTTATAFKKQASIKTAPPVAFISHAFNEPQAIAPQEPGQNNALTETEIKSSEEILLNPQPTTPPPERISDSLDPATRGFIE